MQRHSITCARCGCQFWSRRSTQKFCGDSCRLSNLYGREIKAKEQRRNIETVFVCETCGIQFSDLISQRKRSEHTYCSVPCARRANSNRTERTCERCGATFSRPSSATSRFCSREHYDAARRENAASPDVFYSHVERSSSDGCWMWTGSTLKSGYGTYGSGHHAERGLAHRRAWALASGEEPPVDLVVGHTCDVAGCVRNDEKGTYEIDGKLLPRYGHLWLGTTADNMRDKVMKGRNRNAHGAKYTRTYSTDLRVVEILNGVFLPVVVATENGRLRPDHPSAHQ